jgi:hypothetical protein
VALLLALSVFGGAVGCAAEPADDEEIAEAEGELGGSPLSAGIQAGSAEEEGVLLLVNDRSVTVDTLRTRTRLTASVAKAIVAFRTGPDGAPRWFSSIDEIDRIANTGKVTFQRLVADAKAQGYTEAPGFEPPTSARLSVPDNLGRPPTSNDVTVEAGFDGRSPEEALTLVRGRLTNTVHSSNDRFVSQTIKDTHKAFTIALGNFFAANSPHAQTARNLNADSLTLIGTMSALRPTFLIAEKAGRNTYYARGASGRYEPIERPTYQVIMRSRIQLEPQGVRVFYPAWSAKVLTGPTSVVIEGGQ